MFYLYWGLSTLADKNKSAPQPVESSRISLYSLCCWFFPWLWALSCHACTDHYSHKFLRRSFCMSLEVPLCAAPSSPVVCFPSFGHTDLLKTLVSFSSNHQNCGALLEFSFHSLQSGSHLQEVSQDSHKAQLTCFPSPCDHTPVQPVI